MNEIPGMKESFEEVRVVYLVTFGARGEKHSRPMTNFNKNPFNVMWFPTYKDTRKVKDIERNNRVLVIFPDINEEKFYEIEGNAQFEDPEATREKWRWWYHYWHPEQRERFWFSPQVGMENRIIINIKPIKATILPKSDVEYISKPYESIVPE